MSDILLSHISKSYDGKAVLRDFSARIPEGKVTCIMAPSGGGKTTLLRILMGLLPADEGALLGMEGLKAGAVFQEDRLLSNLSPVSNIRLVSPKLSRERVKEELSSMGLSGCENQPVRELSGGMCRRVAILRALLADCDVLFLDEPFKGLDLELKEQVMERTRKLCQGRTVLLVTHDPSEAERMWAAQILHLPPVVS